MKVPDEEMSWWLEAAQRARRSQHYLMVSHDAHFLNVLVAKEREALRSCDALRDVAVVRVVREELLPRFASGELSEGIYFPVPLARAVEGEQTFDAAVTRFHYDFVGVDEQQRWWWRGAPVADRTRDFLIDHLRWEPELARWVFEYKVHDQWWDKSYLDARTTPLRLHSLDLEGRAWIASLQTGRRVEVADPTVRIDADDRWLVSCEQVGEALIGDGLRMRLIKTMDERMLEIVVAGKRWPVVWEEGGAHEESAR